MEGGFIESGGWRPSCEGLSFKDMRADEAVGLEVSFQEEEVLKALIDLNGDKGPNGFTRDFWQANWEVFKEDVLSFFANFSSLADL